MKKQLKYTGLLLGLPLLAGAQEMAGFRTDNYAGTSGAIYNPALLSSSPYKFDISLFGLDINAANKTANLTSASYNLDDSTDVEKLTGGSKPNSVAGALGIHLPSFSFRINDKLSVGLISRARFLANISELDGALLNSVNGNFSDAGATVSLAGAANMRMSTTLFSDIGVTGSYVVYNEGPHRLSVGATLKYLAGAGNVYLQLDKIKGTVVADSNGNSYVQQATGTIAIGAGGLDFSEDVKFGVKGSGIGADLGVSYEYRPENVKGDFPYMFRAAAALTDIGGISYSTTSNGYRYGYNVTIPAGSNFSLDQFDGLSNKEIAAKLESYPAYFQKASGLNGSSYKVALPHALQLAFDYHPIAKVFVAFNASIGMVNTSSKPYNPLVQNCYWLTPRFETRAFAAYLPVSISSLSGFNVGAGLRLGPVYLGSNSIFRLLAGSSRQLDGYFGIRFGMKRNTKETE